MSERSLFVFTKVFPYGKAEQYLAGELPWLCAGFDRVVLVPCEYFDREDAARRSLPANCEVLLLNHKAASYPKRRHPVEFLAVFFGEWIRARNKRWFWQERKRYASVLLHQQHLADVMKELLSQYGKGPHTFYAYWIHNSSVMLGLMKQRGTIRDFICRGHSIDLYEWDWALVRYIKVLPFYHFIIRTASRVAAISGHGAAYLRNRFPGMKEKFLVERLGVGDKGLNPFRATAPFTIVSCSNFSDNKRVSVIAEVIAQMKTPVRWIHFGDGPGREKTEEVIRRFPANAVAELRGFTPNEQILAFYATEPVHLVINLSEAEGIPVSLMEAISFGIPVMGTAVYGNPEVANDETGFSVPFDAPAAALAARIDDFAADIPRQEKLRSSARAYYLGCFNAQKNYRRFVELLRTPS